MCVCVSIWNGETRPLGKGNGERASNCWDRSTARVENREPISSFAFILISQTICIDSSCSRVVSHASIFPSTFLSPPRTTKRKIQSERFPVACDSRVRVWIDSLTAREHLDLLESLIYALVRNSCLPIEGTIRRLENRGDPWTDTRSVLIFFLQSVFPE